MSVRVRVCNCVPCVTSHWLMCLLIVDPLYVAVEVREVISLCQSCDLIAPLAYGTRVLFRAGPVAVYSSLNMKPLPRSSHPLTPFT